VSTQNAGQSALASTVTPSVAVQAAAEAASATPSQPLTTVTVTVLTNSATILGVFTSLPPTTNQTAPATTSTGPTAGTEIVVERVIVVVQRLFGSAPFPVAALVQAQAPPTAPAPTNATNPATTAVVNAPSFFNPATHRLLFVVGGPEDRSAEDYLDEYDDGRVIPSPERPPLPALAVPRREATVSVEAVPPVEAAPAVEPTWPLACERYFAGTFPVEEDRAAPVPALGTAEGTSVEAARLDANDRPAAAPELLAAVAALGLLNGTRWQKEGTRDGEEPRRRPAVLWS
jgi:hypothetical protein